MTKHPTNVWLAYSLVVCNEKRRVGLGLCGSVRVVWRRTCQESNVAWCTMAAPYTDPALGLEKLHLMTERGDLNLLVAAYDLGFLSLNREVQFRHLNFLKLSVLW